METNDGVGIVNKLICGDSLIELGGIADNSIDAIVCDPPYELGFMGKRWDSSGVAYNVELWRECLRVLKPGGHLLAFGGTRTYHRMACAIEDAGFEVRDMLEWVYACLSEDTEVLTINGWERYNKTIDKYPVLCYDIDTNLFEFHKPLRSFIYENKHTAYRIQSDNTDQIVSRNHRVIVERGGKFVFQTAETLQQQENIPFLESLQSLPEAIYNAHEGTSVKKQDLLARVQKHSDNEKTTEADNTLDRKEVPCLREDIQDKSGEAGEVLFKKVQREGEIVSSFGIQQEQSAKVDRRTQAESTGTNDRRTKLGVERRSNLFQKARELFANKVCQVPERIFGNGKEGRLCNGASVVHGTETGAVPTKGGSSASYQSQSTGQQDRKSDVISEQSGAQITRSTITPIEYKGNVWCVEVPTGAFVARRNGKIFITGNSGFPKSLNIGKAVDKLRGNEREVVGTQILKGNAGVSCKEKGGTFVAGASFTGVAEITLTKGNSEWEGYGTALKPAHEPIIMARKPLSEDTIVKNVLKHGTGAIDIDGCRIPTSETIPINKLEKWSGFGQEKQPDYVATENTQGRFPANIICGQGIDIAINDLLDAKQILLDNK